MDVVEGGDGDGHGRDAPEEAMEGGPDGPGNKNIVAHVGAGIDARDQEIYWAFDELFGGEDDAVPGGALDGVGLYAVAVEDGRGHADGVVEGDGTPDAALLPVRGDDCHVTQFLEALGEGPEAGGGDAVVVGYEDFQGRGCSVVKCGESLA